MEPLILQITPLMDLQVWLWDFGDGITSTLQNPSHTYINGGIYTVGLTTLNQYGSNNYTEINYINILNMNLQSTRGFCLWCYKLLLSSNSATNNVKWYSDLNGNNLVGTGSTFITPLINSTTTYYAQSEMSFQCGI